MKKTLFFLPIILFTHFAFTQKKAKSDSTKIDFYKPHISGVIAMHYLNEFDTNGDKMRDPDGFRLFRARIEISGLISKKIGYELMIDPRTPEPGGLLRDAYIELLHIKNQKIKLGRQKTQFGWENRQSSTSLYTINRAEMSDAVSRGETLRDNGIGVIGHIPLSKTMRLEDAVTFTNGTRMDITGPYDFNTKKAIWGRLGLRYKKNDLEVNVGGSFGFGGLRRLGDNIDDPSDDVYVDFRRIGADLEVENKYFFFATEYGQGTEKTADSLFSEPFGYQALIALKSKWKIGPLLRYDSAEDDWKVLTMGLYYGGPKAKFRIILNYVLRGKITDIPEGHDDRFYSQIQIKF